MRKVTLAFFLSCLCTLSYWPASAKGSNLDAKSTTIKLRVNGSTFDISLFSSETTRRLKSLLPLTIRMKDLHSNEKFFDLPEVLPTDAINPKKIEAGDFMLYGANTLVVFYKSFPTSYSYTRLGKIANPTNLEKALGSGDVTITLGSE